MTIEIIEITKQKLFMLLAVLVWLAGIKLYWQYGESAQNVFFYVIIGVLAIGLICIVIILLRGPFVRVAIADYYLGKKGTEFDEETKWRIYMASGGKCDVCERRCIKGIPSTFQEYVRVYLFGYQIGHIDHIIPQSYGGRGEKANGRLLCADCNLERSNVIDQDALTLADENWEVIEIE